MPGPNDAPRLPPPLPRDLSGGLLLRPARPDDADALAAFHAAVFAAGPTQPDEEAAAWTRDLMRGDHPTADPADFTVVEDTLRGRIVSSCALIPQVWTFGGIPFGVGRPELIATDPAYRRRGLVRAQLDLLHARGAALGHRLQAISGIPYFYRQFGYEPALVDDAARLGNPAAIPDLAPGATEPYCLRPAAEADLPFVAVMYRRAADRALVVAVRDEAIWRYELFGRDPRSDFWHELRIVETPAGDPIGLVAYRGALRAGRLVATLYELRDGVPWHLVTPTVFRALRAAGEALAARDGNRLTAVGFGWTADHPVHRLAGALLPDRAVPFAWYVRLPDLAGFVRHVAPVLERRLAASPLAGYDGRLRLTFYRDGLCLALAAGHLVAVDPLGPTSHRDADAGFPDRAVLYLLLGSRTLAELEHAFPADCWARDEARPLLDALFPKQSSAIWPVA